MSFREWLPIRKRNKLGLLFATLSLITFVAWNLLPYYEYGNEAPVGLLATVIWPAVFSPDNYGALLRTPNVEAFIGAAIALAMLLSGLLIVFTIPFWEILHASNPLKFLIAAVSLSVGWVILWILFSSGFSDSTPFASLTLLLIAMSMFFIAAAMFAFENELSLREAKKNGIYLKVG